MEAKWSALWLLMLTATVGGNKSCSEIQATVQNASAPYSIELGGKSYVVECNMSSQPAKTIIRVLNGENVQIANPAKHNPKYSFDYEIKYDRIPVQNIKELTKISESCQQSVSYKCKDAPLFGSPNDPRSCWVTSDGCAKYYWGDCGLDIPCNCDGGTGNRETDEGFLTKKQDLPVARLKIGGLKPKSNVSFTIGDLVCYGDEQKNAFTFKNLNSFVSLNLSATLKEVKFKFKSSYSRNKDKTIVTIKMENGKYVKAGMDSEKKLQIIHTFNKKNKEIPQSIPTVNDGWHSVKFKISGKNLDASIDGGKDRAIIENGIDSVPTKLLFGSKECQSFIGCFKDLAVDGNDYTKEFQDSVLKSYVEKGCEPINKGLCGRAFRATNDEDDEHDEDGTDSTVGSSGNNNVTTSGSDPGSGREDDDGDNDNTAVIVIVVIFLLLLILLLVAFFITWYLKRNKGVYQTHEGSAENIHGDTDNLTLVTKPSEQEPENDKSKEYYL